MILWQIIKNEWRQLLRSKVAVWLLGILLLLSVFTIWQATAKIKAAGEHRLAAIQHMRDKFTGQGAVNPHSAAHYGHFVYKPLNVLSVLDEGVNPFTGISLRLEAHQQNEAMFSPAQNSSSLVRFGHLRLSLMLQILLPLFLLFVCYNAVTKERENGTLLLNSAQGITLRQLVWGKTLAYSMVWWTVLIINVAALWIATSVIAESNTAGRVAGLLLLYGSYYFVITGLAVYVSAQSKTSGNALLVLLSGWLLCTVLLPKATANLGENLSPLISKLEMEKRISDDNKKGINGHDPRNERTKRFKDSVLKKYDVDTTSKLPVNVDGLTMQADEEYHNQVYDKHFGSVQQTIKKQSRATALSSFINPFAAVRNLSMSLAGTDAFTHFDFTTKAEQYRRKIIKAMNDEMAYGGSKTGDWKWAVKQDYWQKVPDFNYVQPQLKGSLQNNYSEITAMLFWLLVTLLLLYFTTNRIPVIK